MVTAIESIAHRLYPLSMQLFFRVFVKPLWRLSRIIVISLLTLYVVFCVLLFVFQRSLLYFPTSLPAVAEDFTEKLPVEDIELTLSVKHGSGSNAIIYFGGNAEEVSTGLAELASYFPDYGLYLQHYRGYGGSGGKPSENALHADARAVFDLVQSRYENIVVIGRSLGSGVAIKLAAENPVDRLVLVTPYDSILNLARRRYPFVPIKMMLIDEFQSVLYAPAIKIPVLVVTAQIDNLIPRDHTNALLNEFAPGIANAITVPGTEHNTISDNSNYFLEIQKFLDTD